MIENEIPDDWASDAVESMIQREWNQFANPDLPVDWGSLPTRLASTSPSSTDKTGSPRQSGVRRFLIHRGKGREGQLRPSV